MTNKIQTRLPPPMAELTSRIKVNEGSVGERGKKDIQRKDAVKRRKVA